ncbi:putative Fe-S cluster protein YjdI [Scopulibacillus darangshiensis]|uniref:Putative Fe-S cluster protein YjdI n=1 Tax=Scopulibacillus darangshiensis TaxID=442528 RepID=A0A4R2NXV5_9BACL|nr:(4Fe-4S)-binding protein [Scopulibacillus darangshiensis]TCP27063.1 putative Fe-S cluster protein YjdI [Scopulibacillus darangshiensis]
MAEDKHDYKSDDLIVSFYPNRCNHIGACVDTLKEVFNPEKKPWVNLDQASVEEICRTISLCPTGALQYERLDGGKKEQPPEITTIKPLENGPFFVHGNIEVMNEEGEIVGKNTRVALCRCKRSGNQPFCDGTHKNLRH